MISVAVIPRFKVHWLRRGEVFLGKTLQNYHTAHMIKIPLILLQKDLDPLVGIFGTGESRMPDFFMLPMSLS